MKKADLETHLSSMPWKIGDLIGIDQAGDGDFGPLIERLRSEVSLTRRQREVIALILEGRLKRPRHRVRKESTELMEQAIAYEVMVREKSGGTEAAVHEVMVKFNKKERSVRLALSRWRAWIENGG